eukprot:m.1638929 g.1638929  ORF g.1638929 m.1638929 type:complete len:1818 (+) comp32099_c0_seq1:199-5652(+)
MGRRRKGGTNRAQKESGQGGSMHTAGDLAPDAYPWLAARTEGTQKFMDVLLSRQRDLQDRDLADTPAEQAELKSLVSILNEISTEDGDDLLHSEVNCSEDEAVPFPDLDGPIVKYTVTSQDIGKRCRVAGYDSEGIIRFVGKMAHSGAHKVGVELDAPVGLNHGTVGGTTYFISSEEGPRGIFVHHRKVKIIDGIGKTCEEDSNADQENDTNEIISKQSDEKPLDDSGVWQSPAPSDDVNFAPERTRISVPLFNDATDQASVSTGHSVTDPTCDTKPYVNVAHVPPAACLLHTMGLSAGMGTGVRRTPTSEDITPAIRNTVLPEHIDDICDDNDSADGLEPAPNPDMAPYNTSTPMGSPATSRHTGTVDVDHTDATTNAIENGTLCDLASGSAWKEDASNESAKPLPNTDVQTESIPSGAVFGNTTSTTESKDNSADVPEGESSNLHGESSAADGTDPEASVVLDPTARDTLAAADTVTAEDARADDDVTTKSSSVPSADICITTTPNDDAVPTAGVDLNSPTPPSAVSPAPDTVVLGADRDEDPAPTHVCMGWDRDDICSWLEENALDRFEDAVEDWDGTTVYHLARRAAQDSAAVDDALEGVFAVMGSRDRRRAKKAWVVALASLLSPPREASDDTSTPQERTPLGYASTYTPLHQREHDDAGSASVRDWAPSRVDYKEISRQLALERHKKELAQANIATSADGGLADETTEAEATPTHSDSTGESVAPRAVSTTESAASTASMDYREVSRLYALERHKKALLRSGRALTGGAAAGNVPSTAAETAPANASARGGIAAPDGVPTEPTEATEAASDLRSDSQDGCAGIGAPMAQQGTHTQDVLLTLDAGDGETVTITNRLFGKVDAATARVIPPWLVAQYGRQTCGMHIAHGVLEDLSELHGFDFLRTLTIDKNGLTSLSTLPPLPALQELDVTGNPIGNIKHELEHLATVVPRLQVLTLGVDIGPLVMIAASQTLPCLRLLDGREVAVDVPTMWRVPVNVWDAVSSHLSARDVIAFASTCKTARAIAKEMRKSAPYRVPRHIDAVTAGRWLSRWPSLRFVYEHRGPAATLMVDELTGAHQLHVVGASDVQSVKQLCPRISNVCRSLHFERCERLRDLAGLDMVDAVTLTECPSIDRVHMLNELQSLTIADCANVSTNDILYQLDDVPHLTLRNFPTIGAVGQLGGTVVTCTATIRNQVRQWRRAALTLESFPKLRELRGLGSVHSLSLLDCPSITDVAPLRNVHTIVLQNCPRLRDISPLTTCQVVTLENLKRVDCVRALANAQEVTLKNCPSVSTVSALCNVPRVHIEACEGVTQMALNTDARVATFVNCIALATVSWTTCDTRETTRSITIDDCPGLADINGVNGVTFVHLRNLTAPLDLSGLTNCKAVYLTECASISGTNALEAVPAPPHLSIDAESELSSGSSAHAVNADDKATATVERFDPCIATRQDDLDNREDDSMTAVESAVPTPDTGSDDIDPTPQQVATPSGVGEDARNTTPRSDITGFFLSLFGSKSDGKNPIAQWFNHIANEATHALMKNTVKKHATAATLPPASEDGTPSDTTSTLSEHSTQSNSSSSAVERSDAPSAEPPQPAADPTPQPVVPLGGQPASAAARTAAGRFTSLNQMMGQSAAGTTSGPGGAEEKDELKSAADLLAMEQARCELEEETAFSVFSDLGHDARKQGEFSTALSFFFKAITVARSRKGESSSDVANIYVNLGIVYGSMKDHAKEMEYFRKALPVFQMVLGPKHQHVAMTLNNLGIANRNAGEYTRSMMYFNKALAIYCETLGDSHSETIRTQRDRLVRIARSKKP